MRFLCDHMLGTLAKWLRFLGFDTVYAGPLNDAELLSLSKREGRVLLTRDKELAARSEGGLYVGSGDLDEQVRAVLGFFDLAVNEPLSRCGECNTVLVPISKEQARDRVPDGVYERQDAFWLCPGCNRHYWSGSHTDRMMKRIEDFQSRGPS